MRQRKLGSFDVSALGFGGMNLSHAYGHPVSEDEGIRILHSALDMGVTHFDTALQYGFGKNETLIGKALSHRRYEFTLASKCGMGPDASGKREITNEPAKLRAACEVALKRLQTETIDVYYLHRWDLKTPIEETVGVLADLKREGKIQSIGLSEVSADTLRRAYKEHPIAAVQSEYSLWTRNPEIAVLKACQELGVSFVAFSPMARGFLSGKLTDVATLSEKDLRRGMPRFYPENYPQNLALLQPYLALAHELGHTPAELAIAWVMAKGEHILPLPGTVNLNHLAENISGTGIDLSAEIVARLDAMIGPHNIVGARYNPKTQTEIDTEEF